MPILETQVGQIFINNRKLSKSFISLFSEKIAETGAEIFVLIEAGLSSQAGTPEYEKILKSMLTTLHRNFKKLNQNGFENSIAQINEDLAATVGQGQTNWVGKLNACVAVRQNESLSVATTGKIHAYLFRDDQFSDIADAASAKQNPLKAFENFTLGKIAKKDYLIFTTSQLFNYLSTERLQKILSDLPISAACRTIADLIKELADETVSFGTFVVALGNADDFPAEESVQYFAAAFETQKTLNRIKNAFKGATTFAEQTVLAGAKQLQRVKKINLKSDIVAPLREQQKKLASLKNIRELPRAKKFFFSAAAIFAVALLINIIIAVRIHYKNKSAQDLNTKLADIQTKIAAANAAYIYNDQAAASANFNAAQAEFNTLPVGNKSIADQANKISAELAALGNSVEHVQNVAAIQLFSYSSSSIDAMELIGNTLYLVNFQGDLFVPYSLATKQQGQNFTILAPPLANIVNNNGTLIATDKTGGIWQIDLAKGIAAKQTGNVRANSLGLAAYGSPAKLYYLDQSGAAIFNSLLNSGPSNYMNLSAGKALDLAVDGSIYVLYPDKILKFNSKQSKPFNNSLGFAANAKIYTDKNLTYVYVLDPGQNRLMALNKASGGIANQYASSQFQNLKNFVVDQADRIAYILSGQNILVIHF